MEKKTIEFRAEVKKLLDIVIHSLYTHKEIFLRELVSNASDAIDRLRYEALTNSDILGGDGDLKISITADKEAGTLTVSDNGMGMSTEELERELGTIAHSGTKEFLSLLKEKDLSNNPELIGQFGVGFYSAFMVADKVSVTSKKAGSGEAHTWESEADGAFTLQGAEKPSRGTDIVLYLKEEEKEFLDQWRIKEIISRYSDYIEHPIVMDVERETPDPEDNEKKIKTIETETLNSRQALWLKNKSDIDQKDYDEFYKHIAHDMEPPLRTIHYRAEGTSEFSALLYIPSRAPFDILYKDFKFGPALYINRVMIMNHSEELLPAYLRFVKGVVDSRDLPLNVSRETLQNNREVAIIKRNVTKKVLDTLKEMKDNSYEEYLKFYAELGRVLKEGLFYDYERKEAVADLLLFESLRTSAGSHITLDKYVSEMKEEAEEIYYIPAKTRKEAEASPYVEALSAKGLDVLVFLDEVDDIVISNLQQYKGKRFRSVLKGDIELKDDKSSVEDKEDEPTVPDGLFELLKAELKGKVTEVRASKRLKDSPCCLVIGEGGLDDRMAEVFRSMGQEVPEPERVLELNPAHPLVKSLAARFEKEPQATVLTDYAGLLYEQALVLSGKQPLDPAGFVSRMAELMEKSLKEKS